MSATYQLPAFGTVLSHFPQWQPLLVRDEAASRVPAMSSADDADKIEELLMRARIKSGDYFVTLATELDKLAQALSAARAPEAPTVERIVPELLYLDKHYTITPKRR